MTISLPSKWIKENNLKEGDELSIEQKGKTIALSSTKIISSSKKEIDARKLGIFTKNDLSHYYFVGYDELVIHFDNESVLEQVKERVPDCIGYEIIDQTENKVIIKAITNVLENEFDNILRKVFLQLKQMAQDTYDALAKKEYSRLRKIRELETINNRFTSFLQRLLSKHGYKVHERTLQAYDMVQNLERLADEYKYICDSFLNYKESISKEGLNLFKQINEFFVLFYELFYKDNPENRAQLYKERKPLRKKAYDLLYKKKDITLSHHLIALLEKIFNTSGSYLALSTH